jgi:hypothetical protein
MDGFAHTHTQNIIYWEYYGEQVVIQGVPLDQSVAAMRIEQSVGLQLCNCKPNLVRLWPIKLKTSFVFP